MKGPLSTKYVFVVKNRYSKLLVHVHPGFTGNAEKRVRQNFNPGTVGVHTSVHEDDPRLADDFEAVLVLTESGKLRGIDRLTDLWVSSVAGDATQA